MSGPPQSPAPPGGLSYEASGVNYDQLDAFKRACQRAAAGTAAALAGHGLSEPAGVRGESAYLIELPGRVDPQVVATITAWCAEQGVLAQSLRIESRSLEDVFLDLTGRELRS